MAGSPEERGKLAVEACCTSCSLPSERKSRGADKLPAAERGATGRFPGGAWHEESIKVAGKGTFCLIMGCLFTSLPGHRFLLRRELAGPR